MKNGTLSRFAGGIGLHKYFCPLIYSLAQVPFYREVTQCVLKNKKFSWVCRGLLFYCLTVLLGSVWRNTAPPPTDDGAGAHPGMQPDTVSARLLQCCVARCASQQHPETAARPEHSGTNRSAGTAAVTFLTTAGRATLVTGSPTHWLQAGRIDVQDPKHINSCMPQPSHQTSGNPHATSVLQPHHYSTDRLPELTSLTARSVAPLLPSGTLWTLILCAATL